MIIATGGEGLIGTVFLYHITSVTLGGLALKLQVNTASPVSFTTKPSAGWTDTDGGSERMKYNFSYLKYKNNIEAGLNSYFTYNP